MEIVTREKCIYCFLFQLINIHNYYSMQNEITFLVGKPLEAEMVMKNYFYYLLWIVKILYNKNGTDGKVFKNLWKVTGESAAFESSCKLTYLITMKKFYNIGLRKFQTPRYRQKYIKVEKPLLTGNE